MIKRLVLAAMAVFAVASCAEPQYDCNIYGTVNDPNLEGVCVFLVPFKEKVIEPTKENLDSTFIKDGKFEFHTNVEKMRDIRLSKKHRRGFQNLLVITEPGDIHVVIDHESKGWGTPQNDSLQLWKQLNKENRISRANAVRNGATKEDIKAISKPFRERSLQMAHACGDSTTLAKFLFDMFGAEPAAE